MDAIFEKRCPRCRQLKPVADWGKSAKRYDGLAVYCRLCSRELSKELRSRPSQKEKAAEYYRTKWAAMSAEEKQVYSQQQMDRRKKTHYHLRKYSITNEQYFALLESQANGCAICGKTQEENKHMLAVDHDHTCCPGEGSCGKCIRGLLCVTCNVWLGYFENHVWMQRASAYLDLSQKEPD